MSDWTLGLLTGISSGIIILSLWAILTASSEHRACRELTGSTCKWVLVPTYERVK